MLDVEQCGKFLHVFAQLGVDNLCIYLSGFQATVTKHSGNTFDGNAPPQIEPHQSLFAKKPVLGYYG
jgi:hypothetical protein